MATLSDGTTFSGLPVLWTSSNAGAAVLSNGGDTNGLATATSLASGDGLTTISIR